MTPTLVFITGTSGTGKSVVIPTLKTLLNEKYKVYDFDEIWKPYDSSKDWSINVIRKCVEVAHINANQNKVTVVSGMAKPLEVKQVTNEIGDLNIYFCLLTISKAEREIRLTRRQASKKLIDDTEELDYLPKWLKESGYRYDIIDTTSDSIEVVATNVAKFMTSI